MVAIRIASLFTVATAFISTGVHAYGQIAQVIDANNFCIFLPPSDSADRGIASTEWNAEAFCTGNTPQAKNAGKIPSGFIQSAHFLATDTYVQVTGQISPTKGRLDPKDDGGQYDIKAPVGSSCAGWKYYVNLVEPSGNTYCMRCCVSLSLTFIYIYIHIFLTHSRLRTIPRLVIVVFLKKVVLISFLEITVDLMVVAVLLMKIKLPETPPPPLRRRRTAPIALKSLALLQLAPPQWLQFTITETRLPATRLIMSQKTLIHPPIALKTLTKC